MTGKEFLESYQKTVQMEQVVQQKIKRLKIKMYNVKDEEQLKLLTERYNVQAELLREIEANRLRIDKFLIRVREKLTSLEYLLLDLRYAEGIKWDNIVDVIYTDKQYLQFRYERSTYMRTFRRALEKLDEFLQDV